MSNTILDKIVADKRNTLITLKEQRPLDTFIEQVTPSDRDFYAALQHKKPAYILECKKASPSKGLIRSPFDLDEIASVYKHWASAISVLTDSQYFQGEMAFLKQVRDQVSQPVLCKDFIVDAYQIYLGRLHGADAILLMLSVLDDETYQTLADVAYSLNLGILTEVSNQQELERAIALNAKVIGINNRNLRDLTIDLNRTRELAVQIPDDRIVISESGIQTHHHVRELSQYAHGFLVGSAIMAQPDLQLAVSRLLLGENKVCGLTQAEDAKAIYEAGANYGGLIFAEKSPRYVTLEQAKQTIQGAPLNYVGVFVNAPLQQVCNYAQQLGLSVIQLHGKEAPDYITELKSMLPEGVAIWKAHGVETSLPSLNEYHVDRHLLDAKVAGQCGGTGQSFDWALLPDEMRSNIMLAGGLNPDNATTASALGCAGLDFNSGVESAPGKKDHTKVKAAFAALREF